MKKVWTNQKQPFIPWDTCRVSPHFHFLCFRPTNERTADWRRRKLQEVAWSCAHFEEILLITCCVFGRTCWSWRHHPIWLSATKTFPKILVLAYNTEISFLFMSVNRFSQNFATYEREKFCSKLPQCNVSPTHWDVKEITNIRYEETSSQPSKLSWLETTTHQLNEWQG